MKHWKTLVCGVLATLMLVPSAFAASTTPPDVQGHWAQESIERAVADGWVNGYPDGTFRPNATITRAEFVKMVLDAMDLTPESDYANWLAKSSVMVTRYDTIVPYEPPRFLDMDTNWLTKQGWMEVAVNFGLVVPTDYSDRMFHPSKAITRYEIAVMVDRAMGKVYPASQPLTEELSFTDADQIPEWVRGYVNEAVKAGVLTGYPDGTFGHKKSATRAEAVAMVQRMLDYTREGLDPNIALTVHYRSPDEDWEPSAEMTTQDVRMQLIDQVLYVSLLDVLAVQDQLMRGDIYTDWHPIWQKLFVDMEMRYTYWAGSVFHGFTDFYEADEHGYYKFSVPARMLDGEIMVPIYDFSPPYADYWGLWKGSWDEATKTVHLYVYNPGYHIS